MRGAPQSSRSCHRLRASATSSTQMTLFSVRGLKAAEIYVAYGSSRIQCKFAKMHSVGPLNFLAGNSSSQRRITERHSALRGFRSTDNLICGALRQAPACGMPQRDPLYASSSAAEAQRLVGFNVAESCWPRGRVLFPFSGHLQSDARPLI